MKCEKQLFDFWMAKGKQLQYRSRFIRGAVLRCETLDSVLDLLKPAYCVPRKEKVEFRKEKP